MSQIEVLKVDLEKSPKGYVTTSVSYKGADGKVKGMKVFPFGDQASVAEAFKDAKAGDVFDVAFEKNDKGFWQFAPTPVKTNVKAATVGGPAANASSAKGNWETTEERARRQVLIVRQSSLSTAVAFFNAGLGKAKDTQDVINLAKEFEAYVLATQSGEIQ